MNIFEDKGTGMAADRFDFSTPSEQANLELVQRFYDEVFNARNVEAADRYFALDFVQHNPLFGEDLAGFKKFVGEFLELVPDLVVTTHIAIAQNDRVFFYTGWSGHAAQGGEELTMDVADVYRLADGKLTEHWDKYEYTTLKSLGIERPEQRQPSVPIDRTGTVEQRLNLAVTLSYFSDVTIQDTSRAHLYITENFKQYDLGIGQGLVGYRKCFEGFQPLTSDAAIKIENLVVGKENVAAILMTEGEALMGDKDLGFVLPTADVYRIQEDMLTEHWGIGDYTDLVSLTGVNPKDMVSA